MITEYIEATYDYEDPFEHLSFFQLEHDFELSGWKKDGVKKGDWLIDDGAYAEIVRIEGHKITRIWGNDDDPGLIGYIGGPEEYEGLPVFAPVEKDTKQWTFRCFLVGGKWYKGQKTKMGWFLAPHDGEVE
jgi:hypothetical protein